MSTISIIGSGGMAAAIAGRIAKAGHTVEVVSRDRASAYAQAASRAKLDIVDYCGSGVVVALAYPGKEGVSLWVERGTNVISFAPWERCPGRHLQLGAFFRSLFS